jgi:hypothetical protein
MYLNDIPTLEKFTLQLHGPRTGVGPWYWECRMKASLLPHPSVHRLMTRQITSMCDVLYKRHLRVFHILTQEFDQALLSSDMANKSHKRARLIN